MENLFQTAVMSNILFNTPVGYLNVVQVAQLPLLSQKGVSLDNLYIGLKESYETFSKSLIPLTKGEEVNIALRVEIVKNIIELKQAEIASRAKAKENEALRLALIEALSKKQADSLANMSIEEIQAKLKELN
jgi:hypothetical protein